MLGWEFPPFISGGLGVACHGLTRAMSRRGHQVLFAIPGPMTAGFSAQVQPPTQDQPPAVSHIHLPDFENVEFRGLGTSITGPYQRPVETAYPFTKQTAVDAPAPPVAEAGKRFSEPEPGDLFEQELPRYNELALNLARAEVKAGRKFDVVHGHDWLTFAAAAKVAGELGVPLVLHVHSTEIDRRPGETPNRRIFEAERDGLHRANVIICVSNHVAQTLQQHYDVPASKLRVIHNAVDAKPVADAGTNPTSNDVGEPIHIASGERVVIFVGRLDPQKGLDAFLRAASRVKATVPSRFVVAGIGPLQSELPSMISQNGLSGSVVHTGHLDEQQLAMLYKRADLLVMPSPSEPFGLAALEAAGAGVPVVTSKASGATEVTQHLLRADLTDENDLASKMLSVLRDETLGHELATGGSVEVARLKWIDAAQAVEDVYAEVLNPAPAANA